MKPPFQQVVSDYINLIYHFAYRWTHPQADVDDIVHETFLKAFKSYEKVRFAGESELKSWLLTICRNHIFNTNRSKKMNRLEELDSEHLASDNLIDTWLNHLILEEQFESIQKELNAMSVYEEEIVRLRIFEKLSFREIGVVLEISESAAKMRFNRVVKKLKEVLV